MGQLCPARRFRPRRGHSTRGEAEYAKPETVTGFRGKSVRLVESRNSVQISLTFQVTTRINTQHSAIRPVKLYPMLSLWGRRPFATFDAAVDHVNRHAKAG